MSIGYEAGRTCIVNAVDLKVLFFHDVIRIEENWFAEFFSSSTLLRFTTQLELLHIKLDFGEHYFSVFFNHDFGLGFYTDFLEQLLA